MTASLVLLAALAAAPLDDVVIAWEAPAQCPPVQALREGIRRSLAGLTVEPQGRVQARVRVEREAERRWRIELALDVGAGPGERTLIAESCAAAVDTAAWLIAITLDVRAVDPGQRGAAPVTVPEPPGSATGSAAPGSTTGSAAPGSATGSASSGSATGTAAPGNATGSASSGSATGTAVPGKATGSASSGSAAVPASPGSAVGTAPVPPRTGSAAGGPVSLGTAGAVRSRTGSIGGPGAEASARSGSGSTDTPGTEAVPTAVGRGAGAERRLHVDLWAGGGLGLGLLPAATAVASGGLALSGRRWQVDLGGHYWARRSVALADAVGGRFAQGHASLRGCAAWEVGPVRLSPCAGLALGGLGAVGTGPVVSRTARSLWVGLLVGAQVWLRLHARVRLVVQADAVFGLRRPGFTLEPDDRVLFRPSVVGFSGLLGLSVRLR